ncbi:unnamed protein product [Boreogadus saida]
MHGQEVVLFDCNHVEDKAQDITSVYHCNILCTVQLRSSIYTESDCICEAHKQHNQICVLYHWEMHNRHPKIITTIYNCILVNPLKGWLLCHKYKFFPLFIEINLLELIFKRGCKSNKRGSIHCKYAIVISKHLFIILLWKSALPGPVEHSSLQFNKSNPTILNFSRFLYLTTVRSFCILILYFWDQKLSFKYFVFL